MSGETAIVEKQEVRPVVDTLPNGVPPLSLDGLRAYLANKDVRARILEHCNNDPDQMKKLAIGLYTAIECAERPQDILACSPRSIVNCALLADQYQLPLDSRKLAYLTPYAGKAVLTPSYYGFEYVVKLDFPDFVGRVEFIFEGDTFRITRSADCDGYVHEPANPFRADYEKASGLFYHYTYTDKGGVKRSFVDTLPMSEILKSKEIAKKKEIWNKFFRQQAKKTIIRSSLSTKFKSRVAPIEALDNESFDLEEGTKPVFTVSRIQQMVEESDASRAKRAETAPVAPAGEQAANVAPEAEIAAPDAPEPPAHDAGVIESGTDTTSGWDGKSIYIDAEIVERNWKDVEHAATYLESAIATLSGGMRDEALLANEHLLLHLEATGKAEIADRLRGVTIISPESTDEQS